MDFSYTEATIQCLILRSLIRKLNSLHQWWAEESHLNVSRSKYTISKVTL